MIGATIMALHQAYTRKQWVRAVNLSALFGWAGVVAPKTSDLRTLFLVALIGLPIAFISTWTVGAPILHRLMRSNITWLRAAGWGAAIALLMSLIFIAFERYLEWRQSINLKSYSQRGGGDYVREIDGILTAYGWAMQAKSTAMFVLTGVLVGLMVRLVIGPSASAKQND